MWNILGREITPYAGSIWIAGIAAVAVFLWQGKKLKLPTRIWTVVLGIPLALFCARLYYVLARLDLFLELGLENFFAAREGETPAWGGVSGAAFWGAAGGAALAALIAGKLTGERVSAVLDALAPSAALGIGISRFAEYSIGEGIGPDVFEEGLQFFPLSVMNEWEEWYYALFLLEGLVAVCIFALLMTVGRKYQNGYRARMFLILYASCQIVLEAMRRDSFLRWLFVRVSQLTSALVLLGVVVFGVARWLRRRSLGWRAGGRILGKCLLNLLMMLAGIYALLLAHWLLFVREPLEMDGALWWQMICSGWPVTLAVLALMFLLFCLQRRKKERMTGKRMAAQAALFAFPVVVIIAMEFGIDKSADLSMGVGYLIEAFCCLIMGVTSWRIAMDQEPA